MRALLLALTLLFLGCGPFAGQAASTPDPHLGAMAASIDAAGALTAVRGRAEVGRVERIDAKLMSYVEYLAVAGPVRIHGGDPSSAPTTGFGMTDRALWVVAVSGEIWPAGRAPTYFGLTSPPTSTPYPAYRWGLFLVDAQTGLLFVIADAGNDGNWPSQFGALPSHPKG